MCKKNGGTQSLDNAMIVCVCVIIKFRIPHLNGQT